MLNADPERTRALPQEGRTAGANLIALIESTRDLICAVDLNYRLVLFNAAVADYCQHSLGTSIQAGMELQDTLPPPQEGLWPAILERALKESHLVTEYRLLDGRTLEVTLNAVIRDGKKIGVTIFGKDITEPKRLTENLRRSEAKFAAAFDASPAAIAVTDLSPEERLLEVNEAWERATGYWRGEAVGHSPVELGLVEAGTYAEFLSLVRSSGRLRNFEFQFRRKDGSVGAGLISAELVRLDGKPCLLAATTDITGLRRAEAERERLREEFMQAQKMESVGRLAGGVAHDFNNLLTVINGCSDLLLRRLSSQNPLRELVSSIRKAGERAAGLSRQLLTFSRKQLVQPRPVNLAGLIQDSRAILARLVGEDVEIAADLDPTTGFVMADPGQLDQVVMNLVVNARDAMPQGGLLKLRVSKLLLNPDSTVAAPGLPPGEYVLLEISDTGMGMTDEVKRNMFEPFFTTKGETGGTGLGLAMVYGIVQQAGGWIRVESQLGRGTTFRIGLPALARSTGQARVAGDRSRNLEGVETILVVEDDDEVRKVVLQVLTSFGYRVLHAPAGDEALRIVERHRGSIELMLTDVLMPGMNGKQLADQVRVLRPEVKVLFMSGHTGEVTLDRGLLDPKTPYLHKPFTPEVLAQHVRDTLGEGRPAYRILVVDDEAAIRDLFASVLQEGGYEVVTAGDGAAAARALVSRSFDAVIMDLEIPHPEEVEPIRGVRQRQPNLKIIVVSRAYGDDALARVVGMLDADACLQKPVSPNQLLTTVRELLD
jgi:hypothetical protein